MLRATTQPYPCGPLHQLRLIEPSSISGIDEALSNKDEFSVIEQTSTEDTIKPRKNFAQAEMERRTRKQSKREPIFLELTEPKAEVDTIGEALAKVTISKTKKQEERNSDNTANFELIERSSSNLHRHRSNQVQEIHKKILEFWRKLTKQKEDLEIKPSEKRINLLPCGSLHQLKKTKGNIRGLDNILKGIGGQSIISASEQESINKKQGLASSIFTKSGYIRSGRTIAPKKLKLEVSEVRKTPISRTNPRLAKIKISVLSDDAKETQSVEYDLVDREVKNLASVRKPTSLQSQIVYLWRELTGQEQSTGENGVEDEQAKQVINSDKHIRLNLIDGATIDSLETALAEGECTIPRRGDKEFDIYHYSGPHLTVEVKSGAQLEIKKKNDMSKSRFKFELKAADQTPSGSFAWCVNRILS